MNFWDFCAPIYDVAEKTNGRAYSQMVQLIQELVPVNGTILECGAGTGTISLACAAQAREVLPTDLSEPMLKIGRRKAKRKGVTNIEFAQVNIVNIPFSDHSFDIVIASQILHLLDDPQKAVAELKRVGKGMVIAPVCLLEEVSWFSRMKIGLWKLLGFAPKRSFTAESYHTFLTEIGLAPTDYLIAEGSMPLAVAVYRIN